MTFGEYIRKLREGEGFSVRELARRVGCTGPYISRIEGGREIPRAVTVYRLAGALGASPERLVCLAIDERVANFRDRLVRRSATRLSAWLGNEPVSSLESSDPQTLESLAQP